MKFDTEQTKLDALRDRVAAAMDTGNPAEARLALAEHPDEVEAVQVRLEVIAEYGTVL